MLEKTAAVKRDLEKVGEIPEFMFRILILLNLVIVSVCHSHLELMRFGDT